MNKVKNINGIRGWLILVAIGLIQAPIRLVISLLTTYPEVFSSGKWEVLTTQGSDAYNPLWKPIIIGELLMDFVLITLFLYVIYLFFSKSRNFPKWFIGTFILSIVFLAVDATAINMALPNAPEFKPLGSATGLIWVVYMLVSKRVKATFIK